MITARIAGVAAGARARCGQHRQRSVGTRSIVNFRADLDIARDGTFGYPCHDAVQNTRREMVEFVDRIPEIPAAQLTTGDRGPA